MEKIVLEDFHDLHNYYYYVVDPDFAFCSKEKNGKAELLTQFATCRETIAGELFAKISGIFNDRRHTFQHRIKKIPVDKTCIALRLILSVDEYYAGRLPKRIIKERQALAKMDETFPKSIEVALHILNLIEDQYGWERTTAKLAAIQSQGYDVKPSGATAKMMAACFYADKRWMRSPHMISLFLLMLRLPFTAAGSLRGAMKIKTVSKLLEKFKTLRGRSGDGAHARTAGKYIPMIFKNFEELFGKGMGRNFDPDNYKERYNSYWGDYSNYVTEGFNTLCTGKSTNIKIAKAFAVLSKDSKITMEVAARADG
jgi:hypothetical protein